MLSVSDVQQNNSVIHIYAPIFFFFREKEMGTHSSILGKIP